MKIQKLAILAALTFATTGCELLLYSLASLSKDSISKGIQIPLLAKPHETRYLQSETCDTLRNPTITDKTLTYTDINYGIYCETDKPYRLIAISDGYSYLSNSEYGVVKLQSALLNSQTVTEETLKKEAAKEKARKKAEKKREEQEAAEEKLKNEQEAARLNKEAMKKYGKPYCIPYTADNVDGEGGLFAGKKKNCLFKMGFKILQVTPDGMLAEPNPLFTDVMALMGLGGVKMDSTYFIVKHKDDADKVDGDQTGGLFEYIGTYSYESLGGIRTVSKLKHLALSQVDYEN